MMEFFQVDIYFKIYTNFPFLQNYIQCRQKGWELARMQQGPTLFCPHNFVMFVDYISRQQPKPDWTALIMPDNLLGDDVIVTTSSNIVSDTTNINIVNNDDAEDSDGGETVIVQAAQPIQPSPRGGHQLVIDSIHQNIYMFGGWDGSRDLSDFWQYNICGNKWTMLSEDAQMDGGPGPRSV